MKLDTAHNYWNSQWAKESVPTKWENADPEVIDIAMKLRPNVRILDLGAGIGRHSIALAKLGFEVFALDAANDGIQKIESSAFAESLNIVAKIGFIDDIPFPDNYFDHVLSWNVIYHGDEAIVSSSIKEIFRVLKPHGTFHGTMLPKERLNFEPYISHGKEIARNTWKCDVPGDRGHPHYFCNREELDVIFANFEFLSLIIKEHDKPGSLHWHIFASSNKAII